MTYTAISVIGMDIYAVGDRIVGRWKLECWRMAITIYQRPVKLFPLRWQHHRLMVASTSVSIIR